MFLFPTEQNNTNNINYMDYKGCFIRAFLLKGEFGSKMAKIYGLKRGKQIIKYMMT